MHTPPKQIPTLQGFPRVREAREKLRSKAGEILDAYMDTVVEAREAGETEVAIKALQFLMEHLPADAETGEKFLDTSVDKVQKNEGRKSLGPNIKIGVAIGGLPTQAQLGPAVEIVEGEKV